MVSGTVAGNTSAGLESTPKDPINDNHHHRIGGSHAVSEAIITHVTDKDDNRVQQSQDTPSRGQEWDQIKSVSAGKRVHVDYLPSRLC